jgi:hypothetical protein
MADWAVAVAATDGADGEDEENAVAAVNEANAE